MASHSSDAIVEIHTLPIDDGHGVVNDSHGVVIRVEPPWLPRDFDAKLSHVPCDIALVIDVSGSMFEEAPVPRKRANEPANEPTGLSVLDLVKHSCRTILSTMDETDRLAIVTFSNRATVLQPLLRMTADNKARTEARVESMAVESATNLWAGIKSGIKLFENEDNTGRVPAVLVLTDGIPNHMCPPQGYVPALKALGTIVPSLHTFGFGNQLKSGLLKSIAEYGRGNYSFISDAGMIGTVFVHAIAHLQSTFATKASLQITYSEHLEFWQTGGPSVDQEQPIHHPVHPIYRLTIPLGNIQYGQSRDIYLEWKTLNSMNAERDPGFIEAKLSYSQRTVAQHSVSTDCWLFDDSQALSTADIAYHVSRHRICSFLADLFPIDALGEHRMAIPIKTTGGPKVTDEAALATKQAGLGQLIAELPAARFPHDTRCAALLQDLTGPEPLGQVSLALSCSKTLLKWGQHYLLSLHGAHARQLCKSFKDPGTQQYGAQSPLFIACRDRLNAAFDELPPPEGSRRPRAVPEDPPYRRSMANYNSSLNPCFAAETPVRLADGAGTVPIAKLEAGAWVHTPKGARAVAAVLVTPAIEQPMVRWRGVLVTPWHPVADVGVDDAGAGAGAGGEGAAEGEQWVFPLQLAEGERVLYTGWIYSVLLQRDGHVDAHAIMVGGGACGEPFWGVTMGHGVLDGPDVRAHPFFGSYESVKRSLWRLKYEQGGRFPGGGVQRHETGTRLVCGFKDPTPEVSSPFLEHNADYSWDWTWEHAWVGSKVTGKS